MCPQTDAPSDELINEYHAKLMAGYMQVFEQHKAAYGWGDRTLKLTPVLLSPVVEQAPAASSDNSELSPDSWRATCCSRRSFCRAQVACTASPHTNRATGSQPRSEQWPDTLPPPCALGVLPRPHGLAHSPVSCSPLTLDRLRRTAVIAADEGLHDIDIDRTDLSDPALNADLDKPKTLLPHSDVEPSSMMLQPVGESEPSRKNSAAV
eukprot:scaffold92411_cov69-Phaeocystis_antarctica.AAC.2